MRAENKNNVLFQFLSELVHRNWFDQIELYFGPVGHTHNGCDGVHFVHNQICGNYVSITPAELFRNYEYAWHDDHCRPQPIIVETQFEWVERYKNYGRVISHFTKGHKQDSVRAFRFFRHENDGVVNMQIKASVQGTVWYGQEGVPEGPGFVCLPMVPPSFPVCKPPQKFQINPEYVQRMLNGKIKTFCEDNQRMEMYDHFVIMAQELRVPSRPLTPTEMSNLSKKQKGYVTVEHIGG